MEIRGKIRNFPTELISLSAPRVGFRRFLFCHFLWRVCILERRKGVPQGRQLGPKALGNVLFVLGLSRVTMCKDREVTCSFVTFVYSHVFLRMRQKSPLDLSTGLFCHTDIKGVTKITSLVVLQNLSPSPLFPLKFRVRS